MTQPAGDLSNDELSQLQRRLAAFPRLPLILDERQGGDDDGPNGTTEIHGILAHSAPVAIARGADEFEEIGGLIGDDANRLVVTAINALPRLLRELDRRRAQDKALALFGQDGGLVPALSRLVFKARTEPDADCQSCNPRSRTGACSMHIAAALVDEVRNQRLVILMPDAADDVVRTAQERAEQDAADLRGALASIARDLDERGNDASSHADGLAMGYFAEQITKLIGAPTETDQ